MIDEPPPGSGQSQGSGRSPGLGRSVRSGRPERPPDLRLFGVALGTWGATMVALRLSAVVALVGAAVVAAVVGFAGRWLVVAARPVAHARSAAPAAELDARTRWAGPVAVPGARPRWAGVASGLIARTWSWTSAPGALGLREAVVGWALVGVALGVALGGVSTAARTTLRDAEPLASLAQGKAVVRAEMTVSDDPRRLRSARAGPPTYLVPARVVIVDGPVGRVRLDARVLVFGTDPSWRTMLPSQRVVTTARLAPAHGGDLTAAVLTATGEPELLGRPSWLQVVAGRLRAGLQAACAPLPDEPGGLLPGLVIGDTSRLDPLLAEEFRATGLTHLVAVSGANVAIVLGVVLFAARWCRLRPWGVGVACFVALVGFVILVRPSPSVVRAAAMGAIGLLALVAGRARAATPALAAAVIIGLLVDPALSVDVGFVLSVLATGGLVLLAPRWRDDLRDRGVPAGVAEAVSVPAAAQVACAPVIAAMSGTLSLVAIPANLLAVPAIAPATLLGVGATVISPLWPGAAQLLAWVASWPARWLVWVAHAGAGIDVGAVSWPAGVLGGVLLALATVAVLAAARRPALRRLVLVAAVGVAVGAVPVRLVASGWPPSGAVVVACDVGQGDAVVLPIAAGEAVVVDVGPTPVAVDACLRRLGVSRVVVLVVTHFHVDHVGGIDGVLRGRRVGALVVPMFDEPAAGERAVRTAAGGAGISVVEVGPGWTFARGELTLTVIGPARVLSGTRSDPNNNSLMIRAVVRGVSVLLAGDAETEEQHDLLALGVDAVRAQVLKVAHHGSAFQDPALLNAVDPLVALVSVGADNPYGHPNGALLARLSRDGARVLRTDLDGDLAVVVSNGHLSVSTSGPHQPP